MTTIEAHKAKTAELKLIVEGLLKDKGVALDVRWLLFTQLPKELKNHEEYLVHFDFEKQLPRKRIKWYDEFCEDRHSTIHLDDIIKRLEESFKDGELKHYEPFIDAFKEEILQLNLGSFLMDW